MQGDNEQHVWLVGSLLQPNRASAYAGSSGLDDSNTRRDTKQQRLPFLAVQVMMMIQAACFDSSDRILRSLPFLLWSVGYYANING